MKHLRSVKPAVAFRWPDQPFHVALIEPEIPPNTGNIARLCAGTGSVLHLVGQLGFHLNDRQLKRAGLDYWDSVVMHRHKDFELFAKAVSPARLFLFSTRGKRLYTSVAYEPGDVLVFGSETKGLPDEILEKNEENVLAIPIKTESIRSLNLATAVGIVLYEALQHVAG